MELCKYYSLYDVYDNKKFIIRKLKKLKSEGKINFEIEDCDEILKIQDLDLDELELEQLIQFFEDNDVVPYLEREDDEDDDFYDYNEYDE